jgi:CHC2-type zinc finger protein/Toprim domain-containing protein
MNSKAELADLKARVPLATLIGLTLKNGKALCPFHRENTASFHVFPDRYHCFGCGASGDHIDWLVKREGLTFAQAVEHLRQPAGRSAPIKQDKRNPEETRKFALSIWGDARQIKGTLAEAYLVARHIDISGLPTAALRFHPRCIFGRGNYVPALLALFRDPVTNKPTGIHRIRLALDNQKVERRALGPIGGSVIKLWPDEDVTYGLVIGEGIETTLAAATRIKYRGTLLQPAWSAGNEDNLANFPVIDGINMLTVLVDHDANNVGQEAAARCIRRWRQASHEAFGLIPKQVDSDFNDLIKKRAS